MGNLRAHKCKNKNCRKAYQPTRDSQLYCSAKCRQAAYRRRKQRQIGTTRPTVEKPLLVALCEHCSGSFWAQRGRARFCSTSCRTLYHRALKAAIPQAVMKLYGLPEEKAIDIVETQPIGKVRQILEAAGYTYQHQQRAWI
jgi:hypothetical protein